MAIISKPDKAGKTPARDPDTLDRSLYRYIWRHTRKDQVFLILLTLATMPLVYLTLEVPKIIVNEAIDAGAAPPYTLPLFGNSFAVDTTQIQFLLALSFTYLFLVLVNGGFKYHINVFKGQLGERLLRDI